MKRAGRDEARARERELTVTRAVLSTYEGREFLRNLLETLGTFRTVMASETHEIYYRAGRQDVGHQLMASLIDADGAGYLSMEAEARERVKQADRATDAAHTAPLEQIEPEDE